jgi:hypothetical protein
MFSFSGDKVLFDGLRLGVIEQFDNGKPFTGFGSGYIYMRVYFEDVVGQSSIRMLRLCNQSSFRMDSADNSGPIIEKPAVPYSVYLGNVYSFEKMYAYDIFTGLTDVMISVEYGGEILFRSKDAFKFSFDQYGKYTVNFEAKDGNNKRGFISHEITCFKMSKPTITIHGDLDTEVNAGEKVTLPNASAVDVSGEVLPVNVYVREHTGTYLILEGDSFVAERGKQYVVYFYACDSDFNPSIVEYRIFVRG